MKNFVIIIAVALTVGGCKSSQSTGANPALKSERDYAVNSEARAQDLSRTGQASNITEARAQAAAEANQEWAAAAKAKEGKKTQENFEKKLSKLGRD